MTNVRVLCWVPFQFGSVVCRRQWIHWHFLTMYVISHFIWCILYEYTSEIVNHSNFAQALRSGTAARSIKQKIFSHHLNSTIPSHCPVTTIHSTSAKHDEEGIIGFQITLLAASDIAYDKLKNRQNVERSISRFSFPDIFVMSLWAYTLIIHFMN